MIFCALRVLAGRFVMQGGIKVKVIAVKRCPCTNGGRKKTGLSRFLRATGRSGMAARLSQSFDLGIQAALVTSSLILVDQAFVSDAVDNSNSSDVSSSSGSLITCFNGCNHFLQVGTPHRAHACVVLASFFV